MTRVKGPTGELLEFPDNMSLDQIKEVMRQKFPPTDDPLANGVNKAAIDDAKLEKPSLGEKFVTGLGDIAIGAGQIGTRAAPMFDLTNPRVVGMADEARDSLAQFKKTREADWQRRRSESGDTGMEWARTGGNMAATMPLMFMVPPPAAGAWNAFKTATAQGALSGFMTPVDDDKGFLMEKLKGTGAGAALGGGTGLGLHYLSKAVMPTVPENIRMLRDRGVNPTIGQNAGPAAARFEDALSTVNPAISAGQRRAVQEFNRAAYNEALKPVGLKFEGNLENVGYDGVKQVGDKLSAEYTKLLPKLSFKSDKQFVQDLADIDQRSQFLTEPKLKQFYKLLETYVKPKITQEGGMTGKQVKELESQLNHEISHFKAGAASPDDLRLAENLEDVLTAVRDGVERSNPAEAERLKAINTGWAVLTRIERAVGANSQDGVFTPAQLMQAVRSGDSSVRHRAFARGEALLQPLATAAKDVLGNKYPDSGSVGRAVAGLGVLGGATTISPPAAAGLAASTLAYTAPGQRLMGALMFDRPPGSAKAAEIIRNGGLPTISFFGGRPHEK